MNVIRMTWQTAIACALISLVSGVVGITAPVEGVRFALGTCFGFGLGCALILAMWSVVLTKWRRELVEGLRR